MWKSLSLNEALRAFTSGQKVMVADFTTGKCLPLSEVLQRFEAGVLFGVEVALAATDGKSDAEIIKDLTEDLVPTAAAPEPPKVTRAKKQLDEAEKTYQSRKISDIGKLRALRAAGWDVDKIATEFGCSGQTVRNTMKREGIE